MEQVRSWYVSGRQCWLGFLEPLWSLATGNKRAGAWAFLLAVMSL